MLEVAGAVAATLASYLVALKLYRAGRNHPLLLPVVTGTLGTVAMLWLAGVHVARYEQGAAVLRYLSQLAVVAMAVPLYTHLRRLLAAWRPVLSGLLVGCALSVAGTYWVAGTLAVPPDVAASLAPKAATMPIALETARAVGGWPVLAALAVMLSGVFGTLSIRPLLRAMGIQAEPVHAFTLGLVAHAIGISKVLSELPRSLPYAVLGMCTNGLLTAWLVLLWPLRH
ncbi:MAG: hypothetical protein RJA36_2616 [Pseudomonadota bacterium]|jgi:putative effector of murein hydrolase